MAKIIFFGNGPLAEYTLPVLKKHHRVIFHAHSSADLTEVAKIKRSHPDAYGVLASFGVIIKPDLLEFFQPTGILNIHPSKLPEYRGPSPIESAILDGATKFTVSIMQLVKAMDAGPTYHQITCPMPSPFTKDEVYRTLATAGATWLAQNLTNLPTPIAQDEHQATYTAKLTKALSPLTPETKSASRLLREIIAYTGFPKSTYQFTNKSHQALDCIIHSAHLSTEPENALSLKCADGKYLTADTLQPAGRKVMDAKSFINGYLK